MHIVDHSNTKCFLVVLMLQLQSSHYTMPNKGKKKAKAAEYDSNGEVLPRMDITYEDMKFVTGVEPKFKWGKINI